MEKPRWVVHVGISAEARLDFALGFGLRAAVERYYLDLAARAGASEVRLYGIDGALLWCSDVQPGKYETGG